MVRTAPTAALATMTQTPRPPCSVPHRPARLGPRGREEFRRPRESRGPPGPCAAPSLVPRGWVITNRVPVGGVDLGGRPPGTLAAYTGGSHPPGTPLAGTHPPAPLEGGIRGSPRLLDRRRAGRGVLDPTRYRRHVAGRVRGRSSRDHGHADLTHANRPAPHPPPRPCPRGQDRARASGHRPRASAGHRPAASAGHRPAASGHRTAGSAGTPGGVPGSRPRGLAPGSPPYGLLGRASRHCGSLICTLDVSRCALITGT